MYKFLMVMGLFMLTGCPVRPPDVYVFQELDEKLSVDTKDQHLILTPSPACMAHIAEPSCGHGVAIVSGTEVYVGEAKATWFNGKPWSTLKQESVYVPAVESYAPLATYIINACKKMNCSDSVDRFKIKIDSVVPTAPAQ